MKRKQIKMILAAAVFLLSCGCAAQQNTPAVSVDTNPQSMEDRTSEISQVSQKNPDMDEIRRKIAAAVEKARREGKTSVDIYLEDTAGKKADVILPDVIQPGDLVRISFQASLENGIEVMGDQDGIKTLTAGQGSVLSREILGMKLQQEKRAVIEAKDAFGLHKDENMQAFPAKRTLPVYLQISVEAFQKQFQHDPVENDLVPITPYFQSRVVMVNGEKVIIHNQAEEGIDPNDAIGKTTISIKDEMITISLAAKKGAIFSTGGKKGRIVEADEDSFLVDFNHPYAGRKMVLDLKVLSLTKASEFKGLELKWIEDHDLGFDIARQEKKNKVIMLYADWCSWCKKMFSETFEDPRIKLLADRFVWVRANSDQDQSLRAFYGQDGFPMVVISDDEGKILKKMEGFKSADILLPELEKILNMDVAKADTRADN